MAGFRFRLEQVLRWRQTQRDVEELKVKQLTAALHQVQAQLARIKATRLATELEARNLHSLGGGDLAALATYRARMERQEKLLIRDCETRELRLGEQRKRWTEAQRSYKLLEKIRDRQRSEFEVEADRRAEALVAELYLGQLGRGTEGSG